MSLRGRITKDVAEIYEKSIRQALMQMTKCYPKFASTLAKEAAPDLRDRRTGIEYVKRAMRKVPGITLTVVSKRTLVHRDPPGEKLDEKCLTKCAETIIEWSDFVDLDDSQTEELIGLFCSCKCQIASSRERRGERTY